MTEFLSNKVREANDRKGEPCAVKQSINKKIKPLLLLCTLRKTNLTAGLIPHCSMNTL